MSVSLRLNPELVEAAKRAGLVQKRSTPLQIEYWATLGKAVESVIDYQDVFIILQGFKKINVEPVTSPTTTPEEVFNSLDKRRSTGDLSEKVTSSAVYYEASRSRPGLLDRIDSKSGKRETGKFHNGVFQTIT